jgi:hypothetical protein
LSEQVRLRSGCNAEPKLFTNALIITFANFCHISSGLEFEIMTTKAFCGPRKGHLGFLDDGDLKCLLIYFLALDCIEAWPRPSSMGYRQQFTVVAYGYAML